MGSNDIAVHPATEAKAVSFSHIRRISRVVADLERAEAFYRTCLGFKTVDQGPADAGDLEALGMRGTSARQAVMRLGDAEIALVRFAIPGHRYPSGSRSNDLWFQHLAIVVGDMDDAYAYLSSHTGWRAISIGGPQLLPPSNGSVKAFKFRDPDGHPLELIWFPPGQGRPEWDSRTYAPRFMGIDHSAIAISKTRRSVRFYRRLGFSISARSLNRSAAQARLDDVSDARLSVTGLRPASTSGPGLELLAYQPPGRSMIDIGPTDIVTDWVTIVMDRASVGPPCLLRDPDGHRLILVNQGADSIGVPASGPTTRVEASGC